MKIAGYTYYEGQQHYTMKCDASLLNQRKPFFVPDWAEDFRYVRCLVVRISRLGKGIEARYADRYYDAVAEGLDFIAYDLLNRNYAQATAFDNSLCVGDWQEVTVLSEDDKAIVAQAIQGVSKIVTLRIGDMIYIDHPYEAERVRINQIIELNHLYCKIK